jgi:ribonuclease P protein subunit RPR2
MKRRIKRNLSPEKAKIAEERIVILLKLAEKELEKNPERSRRYVELARNIGKRCNIRLTKGQKSKFCKNCNQLLIQRKTSETKVDSKGKFIEIKCMNCGSAYRQRY